MFTSEEVENWNSIFLNGQIRENDLKHPKELFVVRTLVAFLEKFGYKLEPPFSLTEESENTREKRLFLVRLARTIDRILKYTDESYSCCYLEIIKPVPKRTARILEVLLNYYYYYDMFVGDVFKIEQEGFQRRGDLIRNIDKLRLENASRKDIALQMKDEIAKLTVAIPTTANEIANYDSQTKQREEDILQIKIKVEQLQKKLTNLQALEGILKSQVVNDKEVSTLQIELKELEQKLDAFRMQERTVQVDFKECMNQCMHMGKLLKSLEDISNLLPAEQLEEYKDIINKTKENKMLCDKALHEVEMLKSAIKKLSIDKTTVTEELKSKKRHFEQKTREQLTIMTERQTLIAKEMNQKISLKAELQEVERLINEQREIYKYIIQSIEPILSNYQNKN